MKNGISRILIVKIGAIGDVLMALPMIEASRAMFGKCEITWVCGKTAAPLLKALSSADELILVDDEKLLKGSFFDKLNVILYVWRKLFLRWFDLVLIGYADQRYKLLTLPVRYRVRRRWSRDYKKRIWPIPGRYHGNEYLRLVTNMDGPFAHKISRKYLSIALSERLRDSINPGKEAMIVIVPGGAKNILGEDSQRRWPLDNYVTLARRLCKKGIKIAITGAPSDAWASPAFNDIEIVSLIGKTSLVELLSVYGASDIVVTHDSGPMHVAILSGKPVVALFGPTNPDEKISYDDNVKVLRGDRALACSPCYDGRTYAACNDNICMKNISVDQVENTILQLLRNIKPTVGTAKIYDASK